jgi:hypothetical protein
MFFILKIKYHKSSKIHVFRVYITLNRQLNVLNSNQYSEYSINDLHQTSLQDASVHWGAPNIHPASKAYFLVGSDYVYLEMVEWVHGVKRPGRHALITHLQLLRRQKKNVELYIHSPNTPSWHIA